MEKTTLIDTISFVPRTLDEGVNAQGEKVLLVSGHGQKVESRNKNGRIYPRAIWERIPRDPQVLVRLEERGMYSEFPHPKEGVATPLKDKICGIITEIKPPDEEGWVDIVAEVGRNTPAGEFVAACFENKWKMGISSRGRGTVRTTPDGGIVEDDYEFITFDFVLDESTPGANPRPAVSESTDELTENTIMDKIAQLTGIKQLVESLDNITAMTDFGKVQEVLVRQEIEISRLSKEDSASLDPLIRPIKESIEKIRDKMHAAKVASNPLVTNLRRECQDLRSQNESLQANLEAAGEIIESMRLPYHAARSLAEELAIRALELKESQAPTPEVVESVVKRAIRDNQDSGLLKENVLLKKRLQAANALFEALLDKHTEDIVESYIDSVVAEKPHLLGVKSILESCKTREDVAERVAILEKAISEEGFPEDLPQGPQVPTLVESTLQTRVPLYESNQGNDFTSMLTRELVGRMGR